MMRNILPYVKTIQCYQKQTEKIVTSDCMPVNVVLKRHMLALDIALDTCPSLQVKPDNYGLQRSANHYPQLPGRLYR